MLFSLEGCVLKKEKSGEIDYLVKLLTEKGKIVAIAKGAQKSRRRFINALEEFNIIKGIFRKTSKGKLPILESCDIFFIPEKIREDYRSFLFFSYAGEFVERVSYEGLKAEYYQFFKKFLMEFEEKRILKILKPYFELNMLKFLGWLPELERCVKCGYKPRKIFYFSILEGGILCFNCKNGTEFLIEKEVIEFLRRLISVPMKYEFLDELERELKKRGEIERKIWKISENLIKFFLPFEINSLKFLEKEVFK
jgi:DNA repair protein RecO (recombination protein O)